MEPGSEPVYLDKIDWLFDSLSMLLLTAAALGMSIACGDCFYGGCGRTEDNHECHDVQ